MSDRQAAGVLRAAERLGIDVPTRLAVTGLDDDPIAARLGLTTVRQSLREQGAACARTVVGVAPAPDFSRAWTVVERATTRGSGAAGR
jgi:DNA-binding LacI/PurR family transcriptional regulator